MILLFVLFIALSLTGCPRDAQDDLKSAKESLRRAGEEVGEAAEKTAEQIDRAAAEKIDETEVAVQQGAAAVEGTIDRVTTPAGEDPHADAIRCADERYVVDAELHAQIVETPMAFIGDASIEPVKSGDTVRGYRLTSIAPKGIPAKLGAREGDIVVAINGRSLDRPLEELYLGDLSSATELVVTIERDGQRFDKMITVAPAEATPPTEAARG